MGFCTRREKAPLVLNEEMRTTIEMESLVGGSSEPVA